MNTFLNYEHDNIEQDAIVHKLNIAFKLSQFEATGISIVEILKNTKNDILIDVEATRLDKWLLELLDQKKINKGELERLVITVQAKRLDAEEQLGILHKLGARVSLVAGNNAYLTIQEQERNGFELISKYVRYFKNIHYLGVSGNAFDILTRKYNLKFSSSNVMELLGYHSLAKSALWVFFTNGKQSLEIENYVSRRKHEKNNNGSSLEIIIETKKQLDVYRSRRDLFVYLNFANSQELITLINKIQ